MCPPSCPPSSAIHRLVPYAHVTDVERSLAFYEQLGLARGDTLTGSAGKLVWGSLHRGAARLFLALADGPIAAGEQAVLFYFHTDDVRGLREHLLACGVRDGGPFVGRPEPLHPRGVLFDLKFPHYMPAGELRVHDPDGYVLLIGQPAS
ncbi:MAG: hypothetical protein IT453_17990 [Planctomycetes bacterium]|nr:hypothetical protein [Planctomycetota bacterium]